MDIIIIKLLLNKLIYNKYIKYIKLDYYKDNSKNLFKILSCLNLLHEKQEEDISLDNLIVFFYTQYPLMKEDEKILFNTIFDQIANAVVDEELVVEYFEKHRQQSLATEIAMKCLEVSRGKGDLSEVYSIIESEQEVIEEPESDLFVSDDLEVLADEILRSTGLRWRLETMNKMVGSLRKGDFGFIFARPETGKTTFLASEVTHMAEQAEGSVLWFNNEEVGSKVMMRCYQAFFGITQQELFTNLDQYNEQFKERMQGKLKIKDEAIITRKMVEELCEKIQPSLIIFDQLDKIAWPESERHDLKMKAIYQWARELSKKYGPVIAICQAGGTGEGKRYLTMTDVDSSHTAKQGEADFMLGIGKTNGDGDEFTRYLSVCKNKLMGDVDSISELRHGKLPITIHPDIARYADAMKWS